MAGKNIRVVPKISNNLIAVYICIPSTGESRQVALVECPNDNQLNDMWNWQTNYARHIERD